MPAPRLPKAKADAKGSAVKNPSRFKKRADPKVTPLGAASSWMTERQIIAWEAFKKEIPWLAESDRTLVEIAAVTRARLMAGEDVGVQALNLLRQCIGQMGGTPADRTKIATGTDDEDESPTDAYFN